MRSLPNEDAHDDVEPFRRPVLQILVRFLAVEPQEEAPGRIAQVEEGLAVLEQVALVGADFQLGGLYRGRRTCQQSQQPPKGAAEDVVFHGVRLPQTRRSEARADQERATGRNATEREGSSFPCLILLVRREPMGVVWWILFRTGRGASMERRGPGPWLLR